MDQQQQLSSDHGGGLTILLAGSVATYVTSLFIYGFGELIEPTNKIRSMMEQDRTEGEEDQEP